MTRDKPSAAATVAQEESDRLTATRLVLYALTVIQGGLSSVEELGDRMASAAKAFLVGAVGVVVVSNPAAAQEY